MSDLEYLKDMIELEKIREFLKCEPQGAKLLIASYVLNLLFGTDYSMYSF